MNLRPYQIKAVEEVRRKWAEGAQRVCLCLPTGAGKSITAAAIGEGLDALWLVHRRELAEQAPGRAVTIQSLLSGDRPRCDLLIADECHHLTMGAEKWHAVAKDYPRILGLTATPSRGDGSALGDLFTHMVVGAQYSELIKDGYLVPARVIRPDEELDGVAQRPSDAWHRLAGNRRGFAFFSRVEWAQKFADELAALQRSIPERGNLALFAPSGQALRQTVATVFGETKDDERKAIVDRFRAGDIRVLSNCQTMTEGVDVPEAEVCMVARGCTHEGAWLQMCGRILRPSPGKTQALVLDLPGLSWRLGLPHWDREYSLEGKPIKAKGEALTQCQQCGSVYDSAPVCPECGWVRPKPRARVRIWNVPMAEVKEELERPDLTAKERSKLMFRKRMAEDPVYARAFYEKKKREGAARKFKPGWAKYQFKLAAGRWPRRDWG